MNIFVDLGVGVYNIKMGRTQMLVESIMLL